MGGGLGLLRQFSLRKPLVRQDTGKVIISELPFCVWEGVVTVTRFQRLQPQLILSKRYDTVSPNGIRAVSDSSLMSMIFRSPEE